MVLKNEWNIVYESVLENSLVFKDKAVMYYYDCVTTNTPFTIVSTVSIKTISFFPYRYHYLGLRN